MPTPTPFARLSALFLPRPAPVLERRAKGVVDPKCPGMRRIVVTVDDAMFNDIGRAASGSGVTVSEAIRQLLRRGLDAQPQEKR